MRLHLFLASFALGALSANSSAQLSQARSAFDRIRSAMSDLQSDRDDARTEAAARTIQDNATAMMNALNDLGRSITGSGAFESERTQVAQLGQQLRRTLEYLCRNAVSVGNTVQGRSRFPVEADYRKQLGLDCSDVKTVFGNVSNEWEQLNRRVEETKRWLRDRLAEAATMKDNAAKPAEALQRAEEQMHAQRESLNERFSSAFHAWISAKNNSASANARENDAFKQWQGAVQSAAGNQFADRVKDLANRWLEAKEAQMAAERADWDAFMVLERAKEERKRMTSDLSRAMQELRNFAREATGDAINRRWAEFDRWSFEFEREISR
jgi:hypothetical protein